MVLWVLVGLGSLPLAAQSRLALEGGWGTSRAGNFLSVSYDVTTDERGQVYLVAGVPVVLAGIGYMHYPRGRTVNGWAFSGVVGFVGLHGTASYQWAAGGGWVHLGVTAGLYHYTGLPFPAFSPMASYELRF